MHARSWSCGGPQWGWPDHVDLTGTETASGYRYLPITQTCSNGHAWTVARVLVDEDDDEMLADARLIAAAPEMLEALKSFLTAWEHDIDLLPHYREARELALAAIAKAEGRE